MNPENSGDSSKQSEAPPEIVSPGGAHAGVLAEIQNLQNRKAGWGNVILILIISVLMFAGAGSAQWSWEIVMILIPILFVHELGHYVTMRAFDYRNLRMFFIPFFGAAVSGRHYNVPGWKKVLVSMMGPAPGIVLGAIIGAAGMVLQQPWMIKVALFSVILNGINLAPILPLDGGWIFHTLFFCRHPLLDAGFRVVAAIALIAWGTRSEGRLMMFLGIFMLIGVPAAYRTAQITRMLRKRGVPPGSPDDQTIPVETAITIIDEVKKRMPAVHSTRLVAQQTLQVFENLNARPPGWMGTLALTFAYVATVGMAVVFIGLLIVGPNGNLARLLATKPHALKHKLACGDVSSWRGPEADILTSARSVTIIANFDKPRDAVKTFGDLTNRLDPAASMQRIGGSLLVTVLGTDPELRKQWFTALEQQTRKVFVDHTNASATLSISFRLATEPEATALEEEAAEYFSANLNRTLMPPWQPNDRRTPSERESHRLARRTYLKAQSTLWSTNEPPQMRAAQKQIREASRRGDDAAVEAMLTEIQELRMVLQKERLAMLRAGSNGPVNQAVIDLFSTLTSSTNKATRSTIARELAALMGTLPQRDGAADMVDDRFATMGGYTSREGKSVLIQFVTFAHISEGSPALLDWLCTRGATDIKYELWAGSNPDEEEE